MVEVEFKADLSGLDPVELERAWKGLGFVPEGRVREVDVYYQGVDRDFRKTDEALRLRQEEGDRTACFLTYKGPKLDQVSCARQELEVAVSDPDTTAELLEALGLRPAFLVDKTRQTLRLEDVTLCLDQVAGLGPFLELELLVEQEADRAAAEARLLAILDDLGVERHRLSRSSYLELLQQ